MASTGNLKVLVLSSDRVGEQMAGPAIRAYEIAVALAAHRPVTLAAPPGSSLPAGAGLEFAEASPGSPEFWRLVADHDLLVAQYLPGSVLARLAAGPQRLVLDLYDPRPLEVLERRGELEPDKLATRMAADAAEQLAYLAVADFVICASERQRDLWVGALMSAALIEPERYRMDPSYRSFVDVVPFGIPDREPQQGEPVLRGIWPGIGPQDRLIVWGGGVWDWLDPIGAVRATELAAQRIPDLRLFFLGTARPPEGEHSSFPAMNAAGELDRYLRERGLEGETVFVNREWIPYEQRGAYLAEADLGISTHQDHLEARYAFRTRVLDYFWAGLPVVASAGDVLADLIEEQSLGATAPPEDAEALADAIVAVADDPGVLAESAARVRALAPALHWSRSVEPLLEFCARPATPRTARELRLARKLVRRSRIAKQRQLADEVGRAAATRAAARRLWSRR